MHRPSLEWRESSGEDIFSRAKKDELYFRNLFDRAHPKYSLINLLCQSSGAEIELKKLKAHYETDANNLSDFFGMIDELVRFLALIKEEKWEEVAKYLKQTDTRELMMSALYSMQEVEQISNALEQTQVLYSLDAKLLTFFALKDQSFADLIIRQSFWQWIKFSIQQLFWPEKTSTLPADRLQGDNVRQLLQQYPEYWEGPVNKRSKLRETLKFEDIQKLSESSSKEVRHAASKAVIEDEVLRKLLAETPQSQEAANARVNILREYGGKFVLGDKKSKYGQIAKITLEETQKSKFSADDITLENFYFQQFLSMVQTKDGKKVRNGHIALRDQIHQLWNEKPGVTSSCDRDCLIKRKAMIRALRFSPENSILKNMPEHFYVALFSDPLNFRNFLETPSLIEAFSRNGFLHFDAEKLRAKIFQWVLQYIRATKEGYGGEVKFTIIHLLSVVRLFSVPEGELFHHPEVCVELINAILHESDNPDALSFMVGSQTFLKEKNIMQLLQQAQPMQLVEWLTRNTSIQSNILNNIAKIESDIKRIEAENKTLAIHKRTRSSHKKLKENTLLLHKKIEEINRLQFAVEFFRLSAQIIQGQKELRDKLLFSEVDTATSNSHEQALLNAASDPELRKQVWENLGYQAELAEKAGLPYVLLFLRSSHCPSETLSQWKQAFIRLEDLGNVKLLERDWDYLINNVPNFAAWILYRLANHTGLSLGDEKIQRLLDYSVSGYDVLKLLEKEHTSESVRKPVRERLLNNPGMLLRLIRCQRKTLNQQEWANLIIRVLILEKDSEIATQLSTTCLDEILKWADYSHLQKWVESGKTDSEASKIELIKKAYLDSFQCRDELSKDTELKLLKLLLSSSLDGEWLALLKENDKVFDCILNDANLLERFQKSNSAELNERFYVYLNNAKGLNTDEYASVSEMLITNIINNLQCSHDSPMHLKSLAILMSEVRSSPTRRKQVYAYLHSPYFSRNVHSASGETLYHLFTESHDQRGVKTLFFQHPSLGDSLMAKLWLSQNDTALVGMMTREFPSFDLGIQDLPKHEKGAPMQFAGAMIKTLINRLPSDLFSSKIKSLLHNRDFLKALLSTITLPQLDVLLSQDQEINNQIEEYFKSQPSDFTDAMKRSEKLKNRSHLKQLHQLTSNHPEMASLFVNQAVKDRVKNCTAWFDSVVIDFIENSSDHEVVYDILVSCNSVAAGDFLLNFSVPLNASKARIFLFYYLCGGESISSLYNERIDLLREFSERICAEYHCEDYLAQLERDDLAGYEFKFSDLVSEDCRAATVFDEGRPLSQTEGVLYTLYAFVRHLCLLYYQIMEPSDKLYNKIKIASDLYELFSRVVGAEDKFFKQITSNCNAQQLARLIDIDIALSNQFNPFFDWIFSPAPENRRLVKIIKQDPEAVAIVLSSKTMKDLEIRNNSLFHKTAALFSDKVQTHTVKRVVAEREKLHKQIISTASLEALEQKLQDPAFLL